MIQILGVCSGNGVLLHPYMFKKGFEIIGNIEGRSKYTFKGKPLQWEENFGDIPFYKTLEEFPKEGADVIIGHPSCGLSSVFGLSRAKEFRSHKEDPSLSLFLKSVHTLYPKVFLLENLPKLLDSYSINDFQKLFPLYTILSWQGSVSEFGNSQLTRKRLLIIGIRKGLFPKSFGFKLTHPRPIHHSPITSDQLIKELPRNGHRRESIETIIALYGGKKISLKEVRDYWLNNPKETRYKVGSKTMNYAPGVYINRIGSYPKTVRPINRQFNHNGLQLTPREMARIQGIPDNFSFYMDAEITTSINKGRITAAKTPPYEIGQWFANLLSLNLK